MCLLCQTIQTGLTGIRKYDKSKEGLRQELYQKFDLAHYIMERDDFLRIIDLFSYSKNNWHEEVMKSAVKLYYNGCKNRIGR